MTVSSTARHWGTRAEVEKLLGGGETVCPPARYYYRDQGGWKNIMWEGVRRYVPRNSN